MPVVGAAQNHADRRPLLLTRGRIKAAIRGPGSRPRALPKSNAAPWWPRPAMRPICMPSRRRPIGPDGISRRALSSHLAGIRRQEAAGGGREQGSSNSPASSATGSAAGCMRRNSPCWNGIARGEEYERGDRGQPGAVAAARPRSPRRQLFRHRDARLRSLCRGRVADRGRCLPHPCRHRTSGHAVAAQATATATRWPPRARRGGFAITDDDDWSDIFSKMLAARGSSRGWAWDGPPCFTNIPAAKRRWRGPSRRSPAGGTLRALCLRRGTGQWLWRTDRPAGTARPL